MSTNYTLKLKQVWRFIVIFDKMINEFYVNFFSVQHFGMVCKFCCFVEQCSVSLEHNSLVNSYVLCWTLSEFGTMLHIAYQCTFIYKMMKCRNTFWLMYSKLKISIKDKQDSSENTFDIRRLLSYTRTTARVRLLTNQRRVFYRWGLDGEFGPILRMKF